MKKLNLMLILCLSFIANAMQAQERAKLSMGLVGIASESYASDPDVVNNTARFELQKLNLFEVVEKYDIEYVAQKNNFNTEACYSKVCLSELGRLLKVDKMMSGSMEVVGERLVVSLRVIDVTTAEIERTEIYEFLDLPKQSKPILSIAFRKFFGLEVDKELEQKLTKVDDYESTINVQDEERLSLSGPRMGVQFITGKNGEVFSDKKSQGGFDATPVLFQFGYQFEVQYLSQGRFQALFEIIPTISGLDQGMFIPSLTLLNGFRDNRTGMEFAFGPTLQIVSRAKGYYDANDDWQTLSNDQSAPDGFSSETRLDSRGNPDFSSSFVIAVGKSFRSGRMNIPINAYYIPSKQGARYGLSFGFNLRK